MYSIRASSKTSGKKVQTIESVQNQTTRQGGIQASFLFKA